MNDKNKIPLLIAIFININIVVGGGFFLSVSDCGKTGGIFSPLLWILIGLIFILPLSLALATLSKTYPVAGGIYFYSQKILGPSWGFISGWTYLIGSIAGNAVMLIALKELMPQFKFNFPYELLFIIIFTILSFFNVILLDKINTFFTILKTIPFILVIVASFVLFKFGNFSQIQSIPISGIFSSIPIILFSYIGVEACCSIAHIIKDGEKNAYKAIMISLFIIIGIYALIQFLILGIHGSNLENPFFTILPKLFKNSAISNFGNIIIRIAILSSYLGGFYGCFYSNNWTLFTMAQEKALPFSSKLIRTNKFNGPWICILIQSILTILLLMISKDKITLMTMCGFGAVIAYILSIISFIYLYKKEKLWLGTSAIVTCLLLLYFCFKDLFAAGIQYLVPFLLLLIIGFIFYKITKLKQAR